MEVRGQLVVVYIKCGENVISSKCGVHGSAMLSGGGAPPARGDISSSRDNSKDKDGFSFRKGGGPSGSRDMVGSRDIFEESGTSPPKKLGFFLRCIGFLKVKGLQLLGRKQLSKHRIMELGGVDEYGRNARFSGENFPQGSSEPYVGGAGGVPTKRSVAKSTTNINFL